MDDLIRGIQQDRENMIAAAREARELGLKLAEAESNYQAAKHIRALEMRTDGEPVTLIQMMIKGDPTVREKLYARDCAQVEYEAAKEAVNAYKLSARLQEAQASREWNMRSDL